MGKKETKNPIEKLLAAKAMSAVFYFRGLIPKVGPIRMMTVRALGFVGLVVVAGCSPASAPEAGKKTAGTNSVPAKVIQADELFCWMAEEAKGISKNATTVQKDVAIAELDKAVSKKLAGNHLEAVVTIHDVRMRGSKSAKLSFIAISTPGFEKMKNRTFIVTPASPISLPMSKEQAGAIRKGSKMRIRGVADYKTGDKFVTIAPWPNSFAYIHFSHRGPKAARLSLVPKEYEILGPKRKNE